jgi:hypothetical protein
MNKSRVYFYKELSKKEKLCSFCSNGARKHNLKKITLKIFFTLTLLVIVESCYEKKEIKQQIETFEQIKSNNNIEIQNEKIDYSSILINDNKNTNEIFIDPEKLCGYWSLDQDTVDSEINLRRMCYLIRKEDSEDYYNNYIGIISIYFFGGSDKFDIININKADENEYVLNVGITYGSYGGKIPIISYGKLRMVFINNDAVFFEIISHDDEGGGYYIDYFFGTNVPYYRATIDNTMKTKEVYEFVQTNLVYTVTRDNLPLYNHRALVAETKIKAYLKLGDKVNFTRDKMIGDRIMEYQLLTRDGITGPLVRIESSNGETGYTFFNFLKEEK